MIRLHEMSFRILLLMIFIGFAAAAYISYERYHVEANDQTVEMVYDYDKLEGRKKKIFCIVQGQRNYLAGPV